MIHKPQNSLFWLDSKAYVCHIMMWITEHTMTHRNPSLVQSKKKLHAHSGLSINILINEALLLFYTKTSKNDDFSLQDF